MALLWNKNTLLLRPDTNGGTSTSRAHPWSSCNSSVTTSCFHGLWPNPFPTAIKPSSNPRHCRSKAWPSVSIGSFFDKRHPKVKANAQKHEPRQQKEEDYDDEEEEEEEVDYRVLTSVKSEYNDIMILESDDSRVLLLDSTYNVHSILYKHEKWTHSYWDECASLPPILPKGPIAILGLGGGTAAHLMLDLWPELQLEGWEIDQILIDKARDYFGLSDLEKGTEAGGVLNVHIGDALSPSVNICGGYAGILVDLFSDGVILPQLEEVTTWLEIKKWLMPNGRIMVNCGGTTGGSDVDPRSASSNCFLVQNSTIKAISEAFAGEICLKKLPKGNRENHLALTGPMPDLDSWSTMVPDPLSAIVKQWKPYAEF